MLLTDYDEEEVRLRMRREAEQIGEKRGERRGVRKGKKQGIKQGEMKMAALVSQLASLGRMEDIQRAAIDENVRRQLFKEFNI